MPTLSVRADIAVRVCVCSAAASLFAEAVQPSNHAPDPAHEPSIAGAIGSALMLSLLFACLWEPLKERIARRLLHSPHPHGELVGVPALLLMVVLGTGLVWVHTILHHHFETHLGSSIGAGLERGLIVAVVCAFWFSRPGAIRSRAVTVVLLVAIIATLGELLLRVGITPEAWTQSEIVWTMVPCVLLLFARACFEPWTATSNVQAAWWVVVTGVTVIVLTGFVHLLDRVIPLPPSLLYSINAANPHDWSGTVLDDLFFYGGWAGGLVIAPDISDEE